MSSLRSIVYVSSATQGFTTERLEVLLTNARRANLATGVTGVLLHAGGNFMQCLEGPEEAVDATYQRILASRQHHTVIELMNVPIASRSFEGWHMGLAHPSRSTLLALSSAEWQKVAQAPDAPSASAANGLNLLKVFWEDARR